MASRMSHSAKAPSQRQLRAGELIRHELAQLFAREEVHDDSLAGRNATVYVTTLGGMDVDGAVKALEAVSAKVRKALAPKLSMKFIPELKFRKDGSFDEAERINNLLREH